VIRAGAVVTVKGWTSESPRQRLQVLAVRDGYAWCRAEWPKGAGKFGGTHYTLNVNDIEAAPRRLSLKKLRAAMVAAHPDKGGSHEAFIAARAAYDAAQQSLPKEGEV
jgi:hypothetical protein